MMIPCTGSTRFDPRVLHQTGPVTQENDRGREGARRTAKAGATDRSPGGCWSMIGERESSVYGASSCTAKYARCCVNGAHVRRNQPDELIGVHRFDVPPRSDGDLGYARVVGKRVSGNNALASTSPKEKYRVANGRESRYSE